MFFILLASIVAARDPCAGSSSTDFETKFVSKHMEKHASGNVAVSPLGLYIGLSMVLLGTDQETASNELVKALGLCGSNKETIFAKISSFVKEYTGANDTLAMTNAVQTSSISFRTEYQNKLSDIFSGDIQPTNLLGLERQIDQLVAQSASHKITNSAILQHVGTALDLVNVHSLKPSWKNNVAKVFGSFQKLHDSAEVVVPFLTFDESHGITYHKVQPEQGNMEYIVVTIPFNGEKYQMRVVMKERKWLLNSPETYELNAEDLKAALSTSMPRTPSDIASFKLPAFKIETAMQLEEEVKEGLDIRAIFEDTNTYDGSPVALRGIYHKVIVDVTVEGGVATGSTTAFGNMFSKHVVIDKPFIFVIEEVNGSTITPLSVGVVKEIGGCVDKTMTDGNLWAYRDDIDVYTCHDFEWFDWCSEYGTLNLAGELSANEACCICGGATALFGQLPRWQQHTAT